MRRSRLRALEPLDDVVAEQERVGNGFERARVLGARNETHVGRRNDNVVIRKIVDRPFRSDDAHHAAVYVDMLDSCLDKTRAAKARADRLGAVTELQDTGNTPRRAAS